MRNRWESLVQPERHDELGSPDAGEALGVWVLGVLWALVCLWLGYAGGYWVLPGMLLAGLLALWGWRHPEWLWWFPAVVVIATMLQPMSPLPMRTHFGPLVYIDLLIIVVAMVAVVRSIGLKQPLLPRTPVDGMVVAVLALFGIGLLSGQPSGQPMLDFKRIAVRIVAFYATTTVASRPRGSRWVWVAFPLVCALLGVHAVWARTQGPDALAQQSALTDAAWGAQHGLVNILLVALPISFGLSLNAGQLPARVVWMLASLCGAVALTLHTSDAAAIALPATHWNGWLITRTVFACVVLLTMARLALEVRTNRPHESPRWVAMAATFTGFAGLQLIWPVVTGPAVLLLVVGAGLVVGTLRADRRALRSGRVIVPLEKAA
jgi:hypothetical protein